MTNINEMFPSKWLTAADLQGRPHIVKMNYIKIEDIKDGKKKPVLYFIGKEKGLTLNKTNAASISQMHGGDIEQWPGGEIEIYPTETDFQGDRVPCIRVRPPSRQAAPAQDHIAPNARTRAAEPSLAHRPFAPLEAQPLADAMDDEIPF
jgi:hypothetical protein